MIRRVISVVIGLLGAIVLHGWWQRGHEPPAPALPVLATVLSDAGVDEETTADGTDVSTQPDLPVEEPSAPEPPHATASAGWAPTLVDFDHTDRNAPTVLLQRADAALEQGRLFEPPGESAVDLYYTVLDAAPGNARARDGLERATRLLISITDEAFARGNYPAVAAPLAVLEQLRPQAPEMIAYRERMEQGQPLRQALERAERAVERERLDQGERSAVAYLRRVLSVEPENATALERIANVQRRLFELAAQAGADGDYATAETYLNRGQAVDPGALQVVADARAVLRDQRTRAAAGLLAQAHRSLDQGDGGQAETLVEQALEIDPDAGGIGLVRDRIRNLRLYAGYAEGEVLHDAFAEGGGEGPAMVIIPVGSFLMGSPEREVDRRSNEGPQFRVRFDRGFALAVTETTVAEFRRFVEATGHRTEAEHNRRSTVYDERSGSMRERGGIYWRHDETGRIAGDTLPVSHVSWNDAVAYAGWLSQATSQRYRLPSEAEFEYVLRAGKRSRYPWGDEAPTRPLANVSSTGDRSSSGRRWSNAFPGDSDGYFGIAPVQRYQANAFGVHDLIGNVSEWVEDCWHGSYLRAPSDGRAWVNRGCTQRVVRGASWASSPDQVRSAYRLSVGADNTSPRVGFRVARDL